MTRKDVKSTLYYWSIGRGLPNADCRKLAKQRLDDWLRDGGLQLYTTGHKCITKLVNPRHRCNRQECYGSPSPKISGGLDHAEWWKCAGGSFIVTSHVYEDVTNNNGWVRWAINHRLRVETNFDRSWYYPGSTTLIVVYGNAVN